MAITATIEDMTAHVHGIAIAIRFTNGGSIDLRKNLFFGGDSVDTNLLQDEIDADVLSLTKKEIEIGLYHAEIAKGIKDPKALIAAVTAAKG